MKSTLKNSLVVVTATFLIASFAERAGAVEMRPVLQNADVLKMVQAAKQAMAVHHTSGCIAVADADGELLFLEREDHAQPACLALAQGKVKTAARFQVASEVFYNSLTQEKSPVMLAIPGMTALPGGVPLFSGGVVIGAIAISTPDPTLDIEIVNVAAKALN